MKFLIATDYYSDFELVQAGSKEAVVNYIKSQGKKTDDIETIGTAEDMLQDEAMNQADEVLFISDYED